MRVLHSATSAVHNTRPLFIRSHPKDHPRRCNGSLIMISTFLLVEVFIVIFLGGGGDKDMMVSEYSLYSLFMILKLLKKCLDSMEWLGFQLSFENKFSRAKLLEHYIQLLFVASLLA
jgi:hypothetical protein